MFVLDQSETLKTTAWTFVEFYFRAAIVASIKTIKLKIFLPPIPEVKLIVYL